VHTRIKYGAAAAPLREGHGHRSSGWSVKMKAKATRGRPREVERWDADKGFGRTGATYLRPLPRARTAPAAEGVWDALGGRRGYVGFTAPSRDAARRRLARSPPPPWCVMRPREAPTLLVLQLSPRALAP